MSELSLYTTQIGAEEVIGCRCVDGLLGETDQEVMPSNAHADRQREPDKTHDTEGRGSSRETQGRGRGRASVLSGVLTD